MGRRSRTATGVGVAAAAAGAATAAAGAAAAARHASRQRELLDGVEAEEVGAADPFAWTPGRELVVIADDGIPLHVEVDEPAGWEAKPTIVFSHGLSLSLRSWIHQRRAFVEAGYRCVLWDHRGHGKSGWGSELSADVDQLGLDLGAVLDETTPTGRVILIGHSMGGMTMMALGEQRPDWVRERVVGAIFCGTSAGGDGLVSLGFGRMLGAAVLRFGPGLLANIASRQRLWHGLRTAGRDIESALVAKYSFDSPVSQETVRYCADMLMSTDLKVVGAFLPTFESLDKRAALTAFAGIPTLVLNGEGDQLTPPDHSLAIVEALPLSEHVVVTDAGHLVMLEHPSVVDEQFLALADRAATSSAPPAKRARRTITDLARRRVVATRGRKASRSRKAPA